MEASIQYLGNLGLSKKRKPYIIITIDQQINILSKAIPIE
jgi:hypothetical protein